MTSRAVARVFLAVFLLAGNTQASILTKSIQFSPPTAANAPGGVVLSVAGCRSIGMPGEPILPVYPATFILPRGETVVRVTVEAERTVTLEGSYTAAPMQYQAPLDSRAPPPFAKDESVYRSSEEYPATRGALATEQVLAGVRLAFVNVYPCTIIPASNTVLFAPSVRVTVETAAAPAGAARAPLRETRRALRAIGGSVENPELGDQYLTAAASPDDSMTATVLAQYVIITGPAFVSAFQPLADLKTRCGMRARVVETGWISSNFGGADLQEKIRNFIRYAYQNWQTRYVLLGGDNDVIPHRGFYVKNGSTIDTDIPSDLYYACLDGNWNADGDQYFGEPGEEDLLPEVLVGRLPIGSETEIANVIEKISSYTLSPVASQCTSALLAGELLWSSGGVNTWGGDYKDEIRYGSSNYGFTTAGIPPAFTVSTLYDADGFTWSKTDLVSILNAGVNLVNHCGHSSLYSVMRLATSDVPLLTNDGTSAGFFICYSHGCYTAAFDNRDDAGTVHAEDCIGEQLVTGPHGAVAFIGNTRYGWDAPGSTCGVSQFFDRRFFDAVFGEGITTLGDALENSRFANASYISFDAVRWVYYDLCLLGDPSLGIWTGAPHELVARHDSTLYTGQKGFEVDVSDDRGPVAGAVASLNSLAPNVFCTGTTDGTGTTVLEPNAPGGTRLLLSVVSPNHYPHTDTVLVETSPAYLATLTVLGVNDGVGRTCNGDGDGIPESGETIGLPVSLRNVGQEPLTNVSVSLTSRDSLLAIRSGTYAAGDLAPGTIVPIDSVFSLAISLSTPNGHAARVEFVVAADQGSWRVPRTIVVSGPAVTLDSWTITDTAYGNGNGCLEAWEFENLACVYRNRGASDVIAPVLTLTFPEGSWGRTIKGTVQAAAIPAGGSVAFPPNLLWFVNEVTPPFTQITMILTLQGQNIADRVDTVRVRTCGYGLDDAGNDESLLRHAAIVGFDQWHVSAERSHSAPSSWKCGGEPGGVYANMTESVLMLPPLCLYAGSSMTFWHRMTAEAGTSYPYWALDAGVVEISQDRGRTWTIINPTTPYPCRASPYNTIFLAAYQRCYSGTFDWKQETFDLSAYHGPTLLRFHFASDEQYGFEGWYVDDIHVTTTVPADVDHGGTPPAKFANGLEPPYPNPFNPTAVIPFETASASKVTLRIFDVSGRLVRTLLAGTVGAGRHTVRWDGTDHAGRPVASGVYFCRMEVGPYAATARLVLLR